MEAQQYIEASLFLVSDVIILYSVVKYLRKYGPLISSLFLVYVICSLVFYLGVLGMPVLDEVFALLVSTKTGEDGTLTPTFGASVVGIIGAISKIALAFGIVLLSQKLITSLGRQTAPPPAV